MRERVEGFRKTAGSSKLLNRLQIFEVRLEHFTLKRQTHALAFAGYLDQAGVFELLYMVGKGGGCDGLAIAHVGAEDTFVLRAHLLEDLMTARIRERLGDQPDLALGKAYGFCSPIIS